MSAPRDTVAALAARRCASAPESEARHQSRFAGLRARTPRELCRASIHPVPHHTEIRRKLATRFDSIVDRLRWTELPLVDRPAFALITLLAVNGNPAKARTFVARYMAEFTDTTLLRVRESDFLTALGEVALAEGL